MTAKACNSPDSCECCRDWLETKKMMDMSVAELRAELERINADTGEWDAQAEIERLRALLDRAVNKDELSRGETLYDRWFEDAEAALEEKP